jgi:hypothetical protein
VDNQAQLSWEARFGRLAAGSAFAAIVFQIASFAAQVPALKDAPGRNDGLRYEHTLSRYFHDHSGVLLGSAITQSAAGFFAVGALFYLFQATRHRRQELPQIVRWVLVIGPVLTAVTLIVGWVELKHASDRYTVPPPAAAARSKLSKDEASNLADYCRKHARGAGVAACRRTHGQQEEFGKKLIKDNQSAAVAGIGEAGVIALAFAYVIIALNAMRAGLLSRFMGILGIIVGALIVLPLLPQGVPIVQIFWLAALGVLFLGFWPGGRGPAWETGEATPWPTPQARAGLPERGAGSKSEPEPEPGGSESTEPEEEPAKPHPVSKKRKRKRRR